MPELLNEMKNDLKTDEFIREFFLVKRGWRMNYGNTPRFTYFYDDHNNLDGKLQILENNGLVIDVTPGNTKMYRMTEELVELLLDS